MPENGEGIVTNKRKRKRRTIADSDSAEDNSASRPDAASEAAAVGFQASSQCSSQRASDVEKSPVIAFAKATPARAGSSRGRGRGGRQSRRAKLDPDAAEIAGAESQNHVSLGKCPANDNQATADLQKAPAQDSKKRVAGDSARVLAATRQYLRSRLDKDDDAPRRLKLLSSMTKVELERHCLQNSNRQHGKWSWEVIDSIPEGRAELPRPKQRHVEINYDGLAEATVDDAKAVEQPVSIVVVGPSSMAIDETKVEQHERSVRCPKRRVIEESDDDEVEFRVAALLGRPSLPDLSQDVGAADLANGGVAADVSECPEIPVAPLAPPSPPRIAGPLLHQSLDWSDDEYDLDEEVSGTADAAQTRRRLPLVPKFPGSQPSRVKNTKWNPINKPSFQQMPASKRDIPNQPPGQSTSDCKHLRRTKPEKAGCHWVCIDCGETLWYEGWRMEISPHGPTSFIGRPGGHNTYQARTRDSYMSLFSAGSTARETEDFDQSYVY